MTTILVVVANVALYKPDEMPLPEDYDVLNKLPTTASDPALGGSVLPGTAVRDANRLRAHRFDELDHGGTEYGIAVEDQISRRGVVWKRLT